LNNTQRGEHAHSNLIRQFYRDKLYWWQPLYKLKVDA
jgi:hypothetical protein